MSDFLTAELSVFKLERPLFEQTFICFPVVVWGFDPYFVSTSL